MNFFDDRVLEFGDAVDVACTSTRWPLSDRLDRRLLDVVGRVEIRLAGAEADDVAAGRFQRARLVGHRDGRRRLDALELVREKGHRKLRSLCRSLCGCPCRNGRLGNSKSHKLMHLIKLVDGSNRLPRSIRDPARNPRPACIPGLKSRRLTARATAPWLVAGNTWARNAWARRTTSMIGQLRRAYAGCDGIIWAIIIALAVHYAARPPLGVDTSSSIGRSFAMCGRQPPRSRLPATGSTRRGGRIRGSPARSVALPRRSSAFAAVGAPFSYIARKPRPACCAIAGSMPPTGALGSRLDVIAHLAWMRMPACIRCSASSISACCRRPSLSCWRSALAGTARLDAGLRARLHDLAAHRHHRDRRRSFAAQGVWLASTNCSPARLSRHCAGDAANTIWPIFLGLRDGIVPAIDGVCRLARHRAHFPSLHAALALIITAGACWPHSGARAGSGWRLNTTDAAVSHSRSTAVQLFHRDVAGGGSLSPCSLDCRSRADRIAAYAAIYASRTAAPRHGRNRPRSGN